MTDQQKRIEELPIEVIDFFMPYFRMTSDACRSGHRLSGKKMTQTEVDQIIAQIRLDVYNLTESQSKEIEELKAALKGMTGEWLHLKSLNEAAEQHVKILREEVERLKSLNEAAEKVIEQIGSQPSMSGSTPYFRRGYNLYEALDAYESLKKQ